MSQFCHSQERSKTFRFYFRRHSFFFCVRLLLPRKKLWINFIGGNEHLHLISSIRRRRKKWKKRRWWWNGLAISMRYIDDNDNKESIRWAAAKIYIHIQWVFISGEHLDSRKCRWFDSTIWQTDDTWRLHYRSSREHIWLKIFFFLLLSENQESSANTIFPSKMVQN